MYTNDVVVCGVIMIEFEIKISYETMFLVLFHIFPILIKNYLHLLIDIIANNNSSSF